MKMTLITLSAILMGAPLFAGPIAYQCAPLAMTNADWHVTYEYRTADGLFAGSNTLVIGQVDAGTKSVIPAHMESQLLPKSKKSAVFIATYEPDAGLKLEWRIGIATGTSTNSCIIAPGVNTNENLGAIAYSLRWKRIVEPPARPYGSPGSPSGQP